MGLAQWSCTVTAGSVVRNRMEFGVSSNCDLGQVHYGSPGRTVQISETSGKLQRVL